MVTRREIAPKIRRIGDYAQLIQNRCVLVLFRLTATDSIDKRIIVEMLKEIREFTKALLDNVDELIKELEQ